MAATDEQDTGAAIPEWVVTFGDMMSLLLTFFVLLFSMSEIKQEESLALLESLRKQFGHEAAMVSPVPGRAPPLNSGMRTLASMGRARRMDTMRGGDKVRAPVGDFPRVFSVRAAGDSTLGGTVFFPEGSDNLGSREKQILRQTAEIIGGKPQKIEIRGHTSSRPLDAGSPFKTHWRLAYSRCEVVMNYLVELGIDPARIRLGVAADNEPIKSGSDPAKQQHSGRVEVLMLPELASEPPGTEAKIQQGFAGDDAQ